MSILIANALCILKNGTMAKLNFVEIKQGNKLIENVLNVLKKEGFISKILKRKEHGQSQFKVFLSTTEEGEQLINNIRMVSKSGRRIYRKNKNLPYCPVGDGVGIISTSKGILPIPKAKAMGLGGEVLFFIW